MTAELEEYIENHISPEPVYLTEIDRHTNLHRLNGRMCSGHIQGRLLKMIVSMIRPSRVLELGTFTGYSSLCMAEALGKEARIHTVEANDELEEEIMGNLRKSPYGEKVTLHIGDAIETMGSFPDQYFDLIVIDADKRQYPEYFLKSLPLLKPGGYILADNTLWDGHVVETGPHSTQTSGILEFNDLVASTPGMEVAIIPIRDGITIIRKCD